MKKFVRINGVLVEKRIFTIKWACDYSKCKGACCNEESDEYEGAALSIDEVTEFICKRKTIASYCGEGHEAVVLENPFYLKDGTYYTSLDSKGRCAFVNEEKCTCALKLAHKDGKIPFEIPQSCHLYPLFKVVANGEVLLTVIDSFENYCLSALDKGRLEDIYLIKFCESSIRRAFGDDFYLALENEQKKFTSLANSLVK